jgi:hypothetical protein
MRYFYILLFILFGLFFTECKKYPEDPFISLKTAKYRLTKHHWKVKEILYDGVNVNQPLNDSLQLGEIENFELNISYLNSEKIGKIRYSYNGDENLFVCFSDWGFADKKTRLSIKEIQGNGNSIANNEIKIIDNLFSYSWTITKLYGNDLIIKNNKNYEITFKSVK